MSEWINLHSETDLKEAILVSNTQPVLLFKHSIRCGFSAMAKRSLASLEPSIVSIFLIDVISDRYLSNRIEEMYQISHESPQAILLIDGNVVWSGSHSNVRAAVIELQINQSHVE